MQTSHWSRLLFIILRCGSWKSRFLLWNLVLNSFILVIIPTHDVSYSTASKFTTIERMVFLRRLYCIEIVCKSSSRILVESITGTRKFSNWSGRPCSVSNGSKRSSKQQSGGQSNETLSRRTKLIWCLPSLKKCDIIHEGVNLYLKGDDVIRSHRRSAFFSRYDQSRKSWME